MKWGPKTRDILKLLFRGKHFFFFFTSLISGSKNGNYAGSGDELKFHDAMCSSLLESQASIVK